LANIAAAHQRCRATHSVRIIRGLPRRADTPIALTIGNFDGVHRGHQAMLGRLIEAAEDLRLVPAVLTFDPHPREFFARDNAPPRISTRRTKLALLRDAGVARTIVARFDRALAQMSPQAFVDEVLVARLGVRWVLVGSDFRFGKDRAGDLAVLRRAARTFSVEAMATVGLAGARVWWVSLTQKRAHQT
jgi:riboflavin kinase/FMN adenylyltransferase